MVGVPPERIRAELMTGFVPDPIQPETLKRLHPQALSGPAWIHRFLARLMRQHIILRRGTNQAADLEIGTITRLGASDFTLTCEHFEDRGTGQVFLNTSLEGRPYFFSAPVIEVLGPDELQLGLPAVVYRSERRDRVRYAVTDGDPANVALQLADRSALAPVADLSPDGLGVEVALQGVRLPGSPFQVRFLDGDRAGSEAWAQLRNNRVIDGRRGWRRLGLSLLPSERIAEVPVQAMADVLGPEAPVVGTPSSLAAEPQVVDVINESAEPIRAIVDVRGDSHGAPVVIIPPAWGKTKETLLPLAATILATFENAGEPVVVVRFDGIRRRGESYNDPECREPGMENLHYTFTQGANDILTILREFEKPRWGCSSAFLVTFSVAAVEGRRAIAVDAGRRVGGWVSAVGASDPQSLIRVISGGVDYLGGAERGVRFGRQGVQGLLLDIDRAAEDALSNRIAFLEDARRDLASITVPITWLQGQHDAWMDPERVRDVLSCGPVAGRRIVEVPTGHQLKTSSEAMDVFRIIASETARMALGRQVFSAVPNRDALRVRQRAEVRRLKAAVVDLRAFWHDYLVGRDAGLGMELVTETMSYRELMEAQIEAAALRDGERVVDLGCGIGTFPTALAARPDRPDSLVLIEVDFVVDALRRASARVASAEAPSGWTVAFAACDLSLATYERRLPLLPGTSDVVLASLLLNYVPQPTRLLGAIRELLAPQGRLVLSSLRRDADTSGICVDGIVELRTGRGLASFGPQGERNIERALGGFINDAARLLDLEEQGLFRFWDAAEVADMARDAGFTKINVVPAFGSPAQAWLLSAVRGD